MWACVLAFMEQLGTTDMLSINLLAEMMKVWRKWREPQQRVMIQEADPGTMSDQLSLQEGRGKGYWPA